MRPKKLCLRSRRSSKWRKRKGAQRPRISVSGGVSRRAQLDLGHSHGELAAEVPIAFGAASRGIQGMGTRHRGRDQPKAGRERSRDHQNGADKAWGLARLRPASASAHASRLEAAREALSLSRRNHRPSHPINPTSATKTGRSRAGSSALPPPETPSTATPSSGSRRDFQWRLGRAELGRVPRQRARAIHFEAVARECKWGRRNAQ